MQDWRDQRSLQPSCPTTSVAVATATAHAAAAVALAAALALAAAALAAAALALAALALALALAAAALAQSAAASSMRCRFWVLQRRLKRLQVCDYGWHFLLLDLQRLPNGLPQSAHRLGAGAR